MAQTESKTSTKFPEATASTAQVLATRSYVTINNLMGKELWLKGFKLPSYDQGFTLRFFAKVTFVLGAD